VKPKLLIGVVSLFLIGLLGYMVFAPSAVIELSTAPVHVPAQPPKVEEETSMSVEPPTEEKKKEVASSSSPSAKPTVAKTVPAQEVQGGLPRGEAQLERQAAGCFGFCEF
jgi:hypothetical protein